MSLVVSLSLQMCCIGQDDLYSPHACSAVYEITQTILFSQYIESIIINNKGSFRAKPTRIGLKYAIIDSDFVTIFRRFSTQYIFFLSNRV